MVQRWQPIVGLALVCAFAAAPAAAQTFNEQVVELVNVQRWVNGQLPPLKLQSNLATAAQNHAQGMAARNFMMHCDPDFATQPWERMSAAGYIWNAAAENIAAGQSTPATVVAGWMASPGHQANILSTQYRETAVGYQFDSGDGANVRLPMTGSCPPTTYTSGPFFSYWAQVFGTRNDIYPVVVAREAHTVNVCTVDVYVYGSGWAQQMRFSSDGANWSNWQNHSANVTQTLVGNTSATVFVELRNGGNVRSASDTVNLATTCSGGGAPVNQIWANGLE